MKIKDIMTWNVVTVSSDTPIMEARKIMETHKIHRLPVVDKGKLVGLVTLDRIQRSSPSEATTLSVWEINYLLSKMKVKEIMLKDVVTVGPNDSVEESAAKAQKMKLGITPVMEDGRVIGVVTSTDYAVKVLHPLLGTGQPGTRLNIANCNQAKNIKEVMELIEKSGMKIVTAHTMPPAEDTPNGFTVHVDSENVKDLVKSLESKGYRVFVVTR